MISAFALLLVLRRFYYVGRHVYVTGASALLLVFQHFYYVGRHVYVPYHIVPSGIYCTESHAFFISGPSKRMFICVYLNKKR